MSYIFQHMFKRLTGVRPVFTNPTSLSGFNNKAKAIKWFRRKALLYGFCTAAGVTFCVYKWQNSQHRFGLMPNAVLPVVHAAEKVIDSENKVPLSRTAHANFIADVVEKVLPSVVYIEVSGAHGQTPFGWGIMPTSNGSGFIVRSDGLVLTNSHVVGGKISAQVSVKLGDGNVYSGIVQAVDPALDLATIKLNAGRPLPALNLGESNKVRAGEWVIALGSPFSLTNTVTSGIVSSASRAASELGLRKKMHYIQTDALITDGDVVGINSMKVSDGISFAIPSDYARDFLSRAQAAEKQGATKGWFGSDLKKSVSARRYLGVRLLPLDPELVQMIQARQPRFPDVSSGVLVHSVFLGSPAHSCGLKPGDVIVQINDRGVATAEDVYECIAASNHLSCTVIRNEEKLKILIDME